jgi:hypothetical protein
MPLRDGVVRVNDAGRQCWGVRDRANGGEEHGRRLLPSVVSKPWPNHPLLATSHQEQQEAAASTTRPIIGIYRAAFRFQRSPPTMPCRLRRLPWGGRLFFEPRLSVTGRYSCASCHEPEQAYTDGRALAVGTTA